jgi:PPOX class probable F420-dependent enzyme
VRSYTTLPSKGSPVQLNPQQLSHVLAVWPVARFASIGANQRAHQVPIVFAVVDGLIYSPIDGKPKRGPTLQRLRNVARDPSASLLLDRYDSDWRSLWWLRVDVDAQIESDAIEGFDRIVSALHAKYPQYQTTQMFAGAPTILRMTPVRHMAWSAQPFDWESLR